MSTRNVKPFRIYELLQYSFSYPMYVNYCDTATSTTSVATIFTFEYYQLVFVKYISLPQSHKNEVGLMCELVYLAINIQAKWQGCILVNFACTWHCWYRG